ncbi:hypothetical protein [Actinomadura sp. 3N407]|uniref:hypothetical protein n=1 Tax=Actinomadura sp. 3N407 TaxID=3457423 RepID=UPI003FCEDA9A
MRRTVVILPVLVTVSGCVVTWPDEAAPPERKAPAASETPATTADPCAKRRSTASPRPRPTKTRIPWRTEKMPDGSVRVTVGDLDAAPADPAAERTTDHRAPRSRHECETVRYAPVRGWWCRTTVKAIQVSGEIVVNGPTPTARIQGAGFSTHCSDRPGRMRHVFQIERDSWSGWRSYGKRHMTAWTANQDQAVGAVKEACPNGRVGTYNYRLSVRIESDRVPVGDVDATSAPIRTHCGTGLS